MLDLVTVNLVTVLPSRKEWVKPCDCLTLVRAETKATLYPT